MVTLIGFEFASLLSGAALTEYVFQYPGLGRLVLEAVLKSDINLVMASLMIGAIMAGADDEDIAKIEKVGDNTGLAFQIRDDILDVIGDSIKLGKSVGSDEKNDKTTYVKIKGLEESQKDLENLSREARDIVIGLAGKETFLSDLIEYLVNREK